MTAEKGPTASGILTWSTRRPGPDPLAGLLGRLADRLHARAVRTIDSGVTITGEGWSFPGSGLQVGAPFDVLPFAAIAKAEYYDGHP